jgi:hypothetical protein
MRFRPRMDMKRKTDRYRESNLEAATVILESSEKYGGGNAALVIWARAFSGRTCQKVAGGETCCRCGLTAYPGHRPELAGETYCPACCPACNARRIE